jgi:hypothetical protein
MLARHSSQHTYWSGRQSNAFHKRADHQNAFSPAGAPSMPPKAHKNSKDVIEQGGRILLAIFAIKKEEIRSIRVSVMD